MDKVRVIALIVASISKGLASFGFIFHALNAQSLMPKKDMRVQVQAQNSRFLATLSTIIIAKYSYSNVTIIVTDKGFPLLSGISCRYTLLSALVCIVNSDNLFVHYPHIAKVVPS